MPSHCDGIGPMGLYCDRSSAVIAVRMAAFGDRSLIPACNCSELPGTVSMRAQRGNLIGATDAASGTRSPRRCAPRQRTNRVRVSRIDRLTPTPPALQSLVPANPGGPLCRTRYSEEELLDLARKYSFRSRMDRSGVTGPIFVWGRGSVVRDVNGKEYLDFNSGQMCAALGHNHPAHCAGAPGKLPNR